MKIECLKEKLASAVSKCEKISGKHPTLPVLKCILLEVKDNNLILKSTNLDLGVEITFPVKTEEEGVVAVPGSVLNNFIQNLDNYKSIKLESAEGNLKVWTENNSTVIKSLPHEDFPTIPVVSLSKVFKMNAKDIVRGLKSVWYSSGTSSMKPELSSVYIYHNDENVVFVATDSFRLAEKRVKVKKIPDFTQILIPFKNVIEIVRILEEVSDDVEIHLDKNQISFSWEGLYLTSRIIDGVFPDYKQIIPKENKSEVVALKQDLVNSLKLANVFSDNFNQINMKLRPGGKTFHLTTRNADVGETVNKLESAISGEDIDINFNYRYILDCFQSIEADSVSLQFNGVSKPMVIRGVGDRSFMYLVMPMNK
ncbi:MAG: DNA polymerase III subunit beta [Candidatus Taylorbacteria bacterium]